MSGLLRQLQKPAGRKSQSTSNGSDDTEHSLALKAPKPPEDEVENLLGDLIAESSRAVTTLQDAGGESSDNMSDQRTTELSPSLQRTNSGKVILRRESRDPTRSPGGDLLGDGAPAWLNRPRSSSPQLEQLYREALIAVEPHLDGTTWERSDVVSRLHSACSEVGKAKTTAGNHQKLMDQVERELCQLLCGYGPLGMLVEDVAVTDIFIDNAEGVRVLRRDQFMSTPLVFRGERELSLFARGLKGRCGVPDGDTSISRALLPGERPIKIQFRGAEVDGIASSRLHFRLSRLEQPTFYDLLQSKTLPTSLAAWLAEVIAAHEANLLIAGPGGAGKSVLATVLLSSVSSETRVGIVERFRELDVPALLDDRVLVGARGQRSHQEIQAEVEALFERGAQRIVFGELDEDFAALFVDALERGFRGSVASVQAGTVETALRRVTTLGCRQDAETDEFMRRVSRGIDIILLIERIDGMPCLMEVCECFQAHDGVFELLPIVVFTGLKDNRRQWQIVSQDSYWIERMRYLGHELQPGATLKLAPGVAGG